MSGGSFSIVGVVLDERTIVRRAPHIEHERKAAVFDLLEKSFFRPEGSEGGPYCLRVSVVDNRLVLNVLLEDETEEAVVGVGLSSFRRIVRDYFLICESYYDAIRSAPPARIESMDMSRRAVHNEGSELLQELLAGKVEVDFDTARRLFTLMCVLHLRG